MKVLPSHNVSKVVSHIHVARDILVMCVVSMVTLPYKHMTAVLEINFPILSNHVGVFCKRNKNYFHALFFHTD